MCPGKAFADSILFVTIASILAVYDIEPYTEPVFGAKVLPELENQLGIVRQVSFEHSTFRVSKPSHLFSLPKPFNCKIVPRSERHAQMIKELDIAWGFCFTLFCIIGERAFVPCTTNLRTCIHIILVRTCTVYTRMLSDSVTGSYAPSQIPQ